MSNSCFIWIFNNLIGSIEQQTFLYICNCQIYKDCFGVNHKQNYQKKKKKRENWVCWAGFCRSSIKNGGTFPSPDSVYFIEYYNVEITGGCCRYFWAANRVVTVTYLYYKFTCLSCHLLVVFHVKIVLVLLCSRMFSRKHM